MKLGVYINNETPTSEYLNAISDFNSATITIPQYGSEARKPDIIYQWVSSEFRNIRGNSLIWFPCASMPFQNSLTLERFEESLKKHIQGTVAKYSRVKYWDVINEVMAESGQLRVKTRFDNGESLIHPIIMIPNWMEKLFSWAHEANPEAELFINDYRPQNPLKWDAILSLADSLREKGIPVHGIGIQHHHHLPRACFDGLFAWTPTRKIVRKARERNLKVHFTETSIWNNNPVPGSLYAQALAYRQLFMCALDEGVDFFNIWSFTDNCDYHWGYLPDDQGAGLFDADFCPKPAYWALKGLLQ